MDDLVKEFLIESYEYLNSLDNDLIELEKSTSDPELLARIFRAVHTIKGTSGFLEYEKLVAITHVGEGLLDRLRKGALVPDAEITDALLALVDAIRQILNNIETTRAEGDEAYDALAETLTRLQSGDRVAAPPAAAATIADAKEEPSAVDAAPAGQEDASLETGQRASASKSNLADRTIRVDVERLDRLADLVGELVLTRNQIIQSISANADTALLASTQHLSLITTELQKGVMKTRMQPIGNIWSKLPRLVRDIATTCGKAARIEMEGAETELHKTIIEAINDPLTHLVRNAVDHGIETPEEREALGKPRAGCLLLRAYQEGGQVNIEIIDDGAGIKPDRIKQKALERGIITQADAARMSDREVLHLIFVPGFSTAEAVSNISGRGVGMDVVKTHIEKIGGIVDVQSKTGRGTTFKIKIPLTPAVVPALVVTTDQGRYAIPPMNLRERARLEGEQVRKEAMIPDTPVCRRLRLERADRKRAERQIRRQAALLDHAQEAICVLGLDHTVRYWNKSAERLYGWTPDDVLHQDARPLLFKGDGTGYAKAHAAVLAEGAWAGEQHHFARGGGELVVQSQWTLVPEAEDEAGSILVVNTDVTEKKQLEAQFLRAQRLESLGTLAGGIAHDINNILGPILMSIQLLKRKIPDARSRDLLDTLEASAQRGGDILKQMLSFARGMGGERRVLQLNHLVSEVGKILKDTLPRSISVETDSAGHLGVVEGDATQLHQVLMNLCVNARDAMPSGGRLRIEAANCNVDAAYARRCVNGQPGSYVKVSVTDTGVGMPPEVADKIFEPVFTTKDTGTGLGLSTTVGLIKSHGGFIDVDSREGVGTRFDVFLPIVASATSQQHGDDAEGDLRGNGESILVVDDEDLFRTLTKSVLEAKGYRVITAIHGQDALAVFAQNPETFSAVITDLMMPVMDGRGLIAALRKTNPTLDVIAVSGLVDDGQDDETESVEANAFLQKPYRADQLLRTVHRVLHRKPGLRQAQPSLPDTF